MYALALASRWFDLRCSGGEYPIVLFVPFLSFVAENGMRVEQLYSLSCSRFLTAEGQPGLCISFGCTWRMKN
ncbi:hypothetical protein DL95DRAFT_378383 [Leptodontidium sp. 2 PMI_412]|nr:hypothetical protein DL95DRAFT_378383 [Leptodontidium sp. 2 PMI_412]